MPPLQGVPLLDTPRGGGVRIRDAVEALVTFADAFLVLALVGGGLLGFALLWDAFRGGA